MRAARDEIVARTLGSRLRQHRRLEVDEAMVIERMTHGFRDAMTQPQTLVHHIATEVEIAVLQPYLFAHGLIQLKRQRLGAVQELKLLRQQLHPSGGE